MTKPLAEGAGVVGQETIPAQQRRLWRELINQIVTGANGVSIETDADRIALVDRLADLVTKRTVDRTLVEVDTLTLAVLHGYSDRASKGQWDAEPVDCEDGFGPFTTHMIVADAGEPVMGAENSEVSVMDEETDEHGRRRWDEQALVDCHFAAASVNLVRTILRRTGADV